MTCWELTIIHFSADQTCGDAPYRGIYIIGYLSVSLYIKYILKVNYTTLIIKSDVILYCSDNQK